VTVEGTLEMSLNRFLLVMEEQLELEPRKSHFRGSLDISVLAMFV